METTLQVVGAIAIVVGIVVIAQHLRTILRHSSQVRAFSEELDNLNVKILEVEERATTLEGKREFSVTGEIDGLARKVNALANHGRTLELTGAKVVRLEVRVTRLETEIPPKGATEVPDPEES